ncbi:hypothetical protein ESCO_004638 [Escovopsis weberi]|uniref:Extracellular membrane protein CFEM domain-containing protein n=1 Tax=Escovopsis weberi TaxID=150374 RepID=A0A0M9VRK8_ESCWE|nr:hypothetical protein ESCO_004638 [Escovopsis weberi]
MKIASVLLALASLFAAAEACKCKEEGKLNLWRRTRACCSDAGKGQYDDAEKDCIHSTMKHLTHFDTCCRLTKYTKSDCGHYQPGNPWHPSAVEVVGTSDDGGDKDAAANLRTAATTVRTNPWLAGDPRDGSSGSSSRSSGQ